jgi:hypothetical protein
VNDTVSMWQSGRRRRVDQSGAEGCLSDLTFDRLTLSECAPEERAQAQAHLVGCRSCTEVLEAIAAEHRRFPQEMDVPGLALDALARAQSAGSSARHQARWQRRLALWMAPLAGVGLAAAGLLLWTRPGVDEMRAKGGFAVELYVKHAESSGDGKLHTGEALHPGDRVRLRLTGALARNGEAGGDPAAPERQAAPGEAPAVPGSNGPASASAYLAVLAVDTTGSVSVYHPANGGTAAPADPAETPLPGAVELDGTLGTEVILAFSCPAPIAVDRLVSAVQQATDRTRVATDPADAVGPVQTPCTAARYRIEKVARSGAR